MITTRTAKLDAEDREALREIVRRIGPAWASDDLTVVRDWLVGLLGDTSLPPEVRALAFVVDSLVLQVTSPSFQHRKRLERDRATGQIIGVIEEVSGSLA